MKQYKLLIIFVLLALGGLNAQIVKDTLQTGSKKTSRYLPQKGDFALGIDVTPVINFLGNSFNGYGTDGTKNTLGDLGGSVINLNIAPKPDVSIMGKYFISDNSAIRANVGVLTRNNMQRAYVISDLLSVTDPYSDVKLIDYVGTQNSGGSLAFGMEYRIGQSRIQGLFGGDLLFAYQTQKNEYSYGNTLTLLNSNPSMSPIMPALDAAGYRTTVKYLGDTYYAGIMLNAGVEYFVLPKVAIGTELNLILYYRMASSSYDTREGLNPYINELETRKYITAPGDREFMIGTGNYSSKLYFIFYF